VPARVDFAGLRRLAGQPRAPFLAFGLVAVPSRAGLMPRSGMPTSKTFHPSLASLGSPALPGFLRQGARLVERMALTRG
jgi:hypothetical protein